MEICERIKILLDTHKLSNYKFSQMSGISEPTIARYINGKSEPTYKNVIKFIEVFPNLNPTWLITGKGQIFLEKSSEGEVNSQVVSIEKGYLPKEAVPYYDLVISAGKSLFEAEGARRSDGYIFGVPGVDRAAAILPVRGFSMQPQVKEGSVIGVSGVETRGTLNTQHKYLIITREDRMIKYIEHDLENENILWCVAPNYPKFKIYKEDIIEIHRIVFVMNPE